MSMVSIVETDTGTQISQAIELFPIYTRSQIGVTESYSTSNNGFLRYGLLADGRFLMLKGPSGSIQNEIVLVQNWFEELRQVAPTQQ